MLAFDENVSEIIKYANDSKNEWSSQRKEDDNQVDLWLQKHIIPVTDPVKGSTPEGGDTNQDVSPVGLGRGPLMVDQDDHLLSPLWTFKVNAGGTSPKAQEAATKLERFLNAISLRCEETAPEPQWPMVRKDISLLGRGYLVIFPVPANYAGERFLQKKGESKEEFDIRYEIELRRKTPIAWRHWSARDTYMRVYGEDEYTLVRHREKKVGEVLRRWPSGAVNLKKERDEQKRNANDKVKVIEYLDHEHYFLVVEQTQDVLTRWKHHMGLNPGVLFKGNAVPENDEIHYIGGLFHARHALKAEDEAVSNLLTNLRRDTRALTVVFHDREAEGSGASKGKPGKLTIRPGGQIDLWVGEDIKRVGSAQSNQDYGQVIGILQSAIDDTGLRRVFMGQVKSDTTGSSMRMAGEYAALELADVAQGIRTGGRKVGIRILHAVLALEEAVKNLRKETKPDKVYVQFEDKKDQMHEIAVAPEDVANHDDMVQARWQLQTPSDERATLDMVRLAAENIEGAGPIMDIWSAREKVGIEEPAEIDQLVTRQRYRNSPEFQQLIAEMAAAQWKGIVAGERDELTPEEVMAVEELLAVDPEMLAAVLGEEAMAEVAAPPEDGGPSSVPSSNRLREGEQMPVRQP